MREQRRVITGPYAAWAYGLDGFRDIDWVPQWCAPHGVRSEPGVLKVRDWTAGTVIDELPFAPIATLLRHCGELPVIGGMPAADRLEYAVEHAIRDGHVSDAELRRAVGRGGSAPGDVLLRTVMERRPVGEPATESYAETSGLLVMRSGGIEPWRQIEFTWKRHRMRLDFVVSFRYGSSLHGVRRRPPRPLVLTPADGVAVEVDGREFHDTRFEEDYRRRAALEAAGIKWLAFTPRQLARESAPFLALINKALAAGR
jgi:hypothetical protein